MEGYYYILQNNRLFRQVRLLKAVFCKLFFDLHPEVLVHIQILWSDSYKCNILFSLCWRINGAREKAPFQKTGSNQSLSSIKSNSRNSSKTVTLYRHTHRSIWHRQVLNSGPLSRFISKPVVLQSLLVISKLVFYYCSKPVSLHANLKFNLKNVLLCHTFLCLSVVYPLLGGCFPFQT